MNGFWSDLRFAWRQLAAKPGFAAAAILTLALGIGANTAMFSVLSGYLLKPLPYPHAAQLAYVNTRFPKFRATPFGLSLPLYQTIRQRTNVFSAAAVYSQDDFNLESNQNAQRVEGVLATASLFRVLGAQPLIGRAFTNRNTHGGDDHVALISYGLWHSSFGAAPDVVGKTVKLDGETCRIIGVMPQGFAFPDHKTSVWLPYRITPDALSPQHAFNLSVDFIGRLRPGVGLHAAGAQIRHAIDLYVRGKVSARMQGTARNAGFEVGIQSWRGELLGDRPATLWLLQAAALLILLITCVNVANLLLSRILARSHELALRSTLGATRAVLARQLLGEALCLAVPGGLVGVALAWLALHLLSGSPLGPGASVFDIALDWRVGLFALAAVLFTAALVSLLPVRHLATTNLQLVLQEGGRSAGGGRRSRRIRNTLVVTELTLAAGLLAVAGLLLHSFLNLEAVNPGFRKDHLLIAGLLVPPADHPGNEALRRFYTDLAQRVETLPGVQQAAVAQNVPLGGASDYNIFSILGQKAPASGMPPAGLFVAVSQGYFKTLGIPILRGRGFDDRDVGTTNAIVGAELAKKYLHGADPIGKTILMGGMKHVIIGVVPSIKYAKLSQTSPSAVIYVNGPMMPPTRQAQLVIHTDRAPLALAKPLQKMLHAVDPSIAVYDVHTMHEQIADALGDKRMTMTLLLAFGGIALALAIIGIYAIFSHAVGQRKNEFGIRLALGAVPGDIQRLIIRDGLKLLGLGLVVGLALAVLFGHILSPLLFEVVPYDPLTLAGAVVVLTLTTVIACYLPARRAARTHPATAIMEQ